ncbi:hypothetical protein JTE90_003098 [Oedothorax gibbosus]|uniref:alpha-glucosidase n=1 Tax=Oedothorax gibbosus TaxID=931172 RepID=A0AAV6VG31_9ARAC|nr:hypothetical protein JTE90_003098 [Oedothorax gibbosus]
MSLDWWQKSIIYHIYLPSFKDSNNDGIGDLPGLISTLNYFKELGVSSLLLSPFYPSPMKDNGYDITSFIEVDPMFGSMDDFDCLISEAKRRGLNIIIDFVANHTSDQHPWFQKSIKREHPYTDFYVWVDPKPGSTENNLIPPNNWLSVFGGSAWTWNEERGQFYFHQFLPEQPDLNFRDTLVRYEMQNVLRFWLDKGVDGFRIDAASHLFEDSRLLDEPRAEESSALPDEYGYLNHIYTKGLDSVLGLLAEWRQTLNEYSKKMKKSRIMLVEGMEDLRDVLKYYGTVSNKLAEIPMNFELYKITSTSTGREVQVIVDKWLKNMPLGKYPNHVLSSHDFPRVASRVGRTLAGSLQMMMMLLPGIPICYYGDELGMENGTIAPAEIRDSFALRTTPSNSRDPMRTPMLWNGEQNAGFSEAIFQDKTWLPVNDNYQTLNVQFQREDPFSFLNNFKKLIKLRRESSVLLGTLMYLPVNINIFSFLRLMASAKCVLVIINLNSEPMTVDLTTTSAPLPPVAYMEVTNPEYYGATRSKYGQSSHRSGASSSRAWAGWGDPSKEVIMVPLNDVSLEPKQGMVLSFQGIV